MAVLNLYAVKFYFMILGSLITTFAIDFELQFAVAIPHII